MTNKQKQILRTWRFSITKDRSIQLDHNNYGTILIMKNKEYNRFEIKHNGGYANMKGKYALYGTSKMALIHTGEYVEALEAGTILGKTMVNFSSDVNERKAS